MNDKTNSANTQAPATEVVDENHIIAERREKLAKLRSNGVAFPNDFMPTHLAADLHALPHLMDTAQVTVVTVAVAADGNLEVHLGVFFIRLGAAQIPRDTGRAAPGVIPARSLGLESIGVQ